jgi:hypothetical protein
MKLRLRGLLAFFLFLLLPAGAYAAPPPRVYVILWFDTEDYLLPASDDAALHIAQFLSSEDIHGTFKVVGEKARTLQRRKRDDVITALNKHEIGYHSNYHSVHPTPAQYLSTLGWDEGVAEFDRRERPGFEDVKRVFGKTPTCYGQPGSSWGPQSFGAMRNWGMDVYLDAGTHVRLDGRPHFYCGVFTLYQLQYLMRTGLGGPKDEKEAEERFAAAREKLLAEGGGMVSVIYHPCEFVHKQFWDGVNFRLGANPPREEWQVPPQKTPEETRVAYDCFESWVRFMKRFDDVRFVTASEAATLHRDRARDRTFTAAEIKGLAGTVTEDVTFVKRDDYTLAASEVLALLNAYLVARTSGGEAARVAWQGTPYGPATPTPPLEAAVTADWSQFTRTAADVADYLKKHGRVPPTVWLGSTGVPPESYLAALARVVSELADGRPPPKEVEVRPAKLAAGKYVADDGPELWSWVIFPKGVRAPAMMELARRQAWTIKPAILHGE